MQYFCGARNTVGFSSQLQEGELPPQSHLTYQGVFNEIKYNVGAKTDKIIDVSLGYSRFQFSDSKFDAKINDYLAIFLKSKYDGQDRSSSVNMNLAICLDVSGSMSVGLGNAKSDKSRLSLSIQAIRMLISKLKPNDSVSLVVFNNYPLVIFNQMLKKQVNSEIYQRLDYILAKGGTTIFNGFNASHQLLKKWIGVHKEGVSQNRIVVLTDVGDDSLKNHKHFIEASAEKDNINTTIIGISTDFKSQICQLFKDIRGFNYFCAVQDQDIKKYVFQTFDFGFFPSAHNIELSLSSQDILDIQVFGTPDSSVSKSYQTQNTQDLGVWPITKLKSVFPSEIQIHGDTIYTVGGLILIKLHRKSANPFFIGEISLTYDSIQGQSFKQKYEVNFQFHPQQQFFTGEELREAIQGYVFTSELKQILNSCSKNKDKCYIWENYWPTLNKIENICPKSKEKELQNIKKIIQKYDPKNAKVPL